MILAVEHSSPNSAARFSDRIENYVRYRPSYPLEALRFIREHADLAAGDTVVDLGSGTGIFSRLLLQDGFRVFGVEPNDGMREAAVHELGLVPEFRSVAGWSHETGLGGACADLITAAQAFHWFDICKTKKECQRLLKPNAATAILFNERLTDASEFLIGYEALLQRYATDYNAINHTKISDEDYREFFGNDQFQKGSFANVQEFDYEGLEGRLLSSSYAPAKGHSDHEAMIGCLRELFDRTAINDLVYFEYQTLVCLGRISNA